MPAIIPIALAGASMIASNVQQKAANKNNDNQNQKAIDLNKQSQTDAQNRVDSYQAANSPTFNVGAAPRLNAPGLMNGFRPQAGGQVGNPMGPNPMNAMMAQMMAHLQAPPAAAPPPVMAPPSPYKFGTP